MKHIKNQSLLFVALRSCRKHFRAAALFSALVNVLYIAPTIYMLQVYDRVVPTQGIKTLLFLTLILLFALFVLSFVDRIRQRLLIRGGVQMDKILAPLILDATLGRPDMPVARQALREFDQMRSTLTGPGIIAVFDAPWVPIYLVICFMVHPWIGALATAGCILMPVLAWANDRATHRRLDLALRVASESYTHQDILLGSADSLRALGMRRAMVSRQIRQRDAMLLAQTEAGFATGNFLALTKFFRMALQSLALGLGALLAVDNMISGGAIFAAAFLIARALQPIEQLIGTWKAIIQARQAYNNIEKLLSSVNLKTNKTDLPAPVGGLLLENVTVFDDQREHAIISNISFKVEPGQVIAIIGPSGAGKSTLARTIAGAILPDRGVIRMDQADMRDWDHEKLAQYIGYLPQDSALFAGTVAENIARFSGELSGDQAEIDSAVIAAASKVGAANLIARLHEGYDHKLKLHGQGLSTGQAQRIALARAVFGNPAILILDEPNAHLDGEGDTALIHALAALKAEGRTILIVSHKLGILPVVDKILVMKDGKLEVFGKKDEILHKITSGKSRDNLKSALTGAK